MKFEAHRAVEIWRRSLLRGCYIQTCYIKQAIWKLAILTMVMDMWYFQSPQTAFNIKIYNLHWHWHSHQFNTQHHHIFMPNHNWSSWHQISQSKRRNNLRLATAGRALETLPAMDCLTSPEAARVAAPSMMSAGVSCLRFLLALESGLGGVGCGRDLSVLPPEAGSRVSQPLVWNSCRTSGVNTTSKVLTRCVWISPSKF